MEKAAGIVGAPGPMTRSIRQVVTLTKGNAGFTTVLKIKEGEGELNGSTQYCDAGLGKGVVVTATNSAKDGVACPAGST